MPGLLGGDRCADIVDIEVKFGGGGCYPLDAAARTARSKGGCVMRKKLLYLLRLAVLKREILGGGAGCSAIR